jgi:hypothetical protein
MHQDNKESNIVHKDHMDFGLKLKCNDIIQFRLNIIRSKNLSTRFYFTETLKKSII